jgi:curved DNA-binding protein CbpA
MASTMPISATKQLILPMPHSHYDNLSVSTDAPLEVITASYKVLINKYSDANYPNDDEAKRIRTVLSASYEVLSSSEKRASHDVWLANAKAQIKTVAQKTVPSAPANIVAPQPTLASNAAIPKLPIPATQTSFNPIVWFFGFGITIAILSGLMNSQSRKPNATQLADATIPTVTKPAAIAFTPDLGILAINANLRADATAKSKIIRVLPRGTFALKIGAQNGFTNIQMEDRAKGWVADELLMPKSDLDRLANITVENYIQSNGGSERPNQMWVLAKPILANHLFSILEEAQNKKNEALKQLQNMPAIDSTQHPKSDVAAGQWFAEAALAEKAKSNLTATIQNYAAATVAAPSEPSYYTGLALATYEADNSVTNDQAAFTSLALAPKATNSWLVLGLTLANRSKKTEELRAATGAFMLAIHFSRNAGFTKKYILDLTEKTNNIKIAQALREAVQEMDNNTNAFME